MENSLSVRWGWKRTVSLVLRLLLAVVFMGSAVAKMFSMDDFELYVYSYGFLSLEVVYIAVRLCIVAEFVLGLFLALGCWPKTVRLLVFCMLIGFSLFLCYAALIGRNDSCQCFGKMMEMSPTVSLLKNAVLIVLLLLYWRLDRGRKPIRMPVWVGAVLTVAAAATVFIVSVPDSWMFGPEEGRYDKDLALEELHNRGLDEGQYVVAFVTPGCPYCKKSRSKMGSMIQRFDLDEDHFVYLDPEEVGGERFLAITFGQRPLILLVDDGQILATYHYRNISERQIKKCLKK